MLATAPGAKLSATIAAFSAALQRRRRGTPVRTSTRRKLCPSIGKLLGKPASLPRLNEAGSSLRPQLTQDGSSVSFTKRLEGGTFKWPPVSEGVMRLSGAQFAALFDGLDWRRMYAPRVPRPKVAG